MEQQRQVNMDDILKLLGQKDLELSISKSDNMKLLNELGRVKKELEALTGGRNDKKSGREGSSKDRKPPK